MDYAAESLKKHYEWKGKLEMTPRAAVDNKEALSLAYTPGVAQPCLEIQKDVPPLEHSGCRDRRHGGSRPRRYRSGSRYAGHGGQVRALQGIRRRGRSPALRAQQKC
jgi:hypothetical protein